jgi:hypothetical protein
MPGECALNTGDLDPWGGHGYHYEKVIGIIVFMHGVMLGIRKLGAQNPREAII